MSLLVGERALPAASASASADVQRRRIVFVNARDAHLWFTHAPPPVLVRAEQNLIAKDDPVVVIDLTPRGASRLAKVAQQGGS